MPISGYDNTQPTRQSFAFNVQKPSNAPLNAQATFRPIQSVGGDTVSGYIQPEAGAAPLSSVANLGGFFNTLMEPYVERKKEELFLKGVTDQMTAEAGHEIRASNGVLNKVFGPSSYEEGAIFYSAKDAVNRMQADALADMDNLKRLPANELTKVIAQKMDGLMSGDRYTDLAVRASLLEASGPLISSIAKERFVWQQDTAKANFSEAQKSAVGVYQKYAQTFASTSDPSDEQALGMRAATNNFLTGLQKPAGMTEESWADSLIGTYRHAAQSGNGYAVTAMKQSGLLAALPVDKQTQLEDAELKYGNRAIGDAAVTMADRLNILDGNITFGRISAADAMAEAVSINEALKRQTGFDIDLMDYKEVVGMGKGVWSALKSNLERQQDHQWQLERDAAERQARLAEKQAEASQAAAAWSMGRPSMAMINGVGDANAYNALAQQDYASGNFGRIAQAFSNEGFVSSYVKSQVQANVATYVGREYNKDFELAYNRFSALNKASPAAAAEYYGTYYPALLNYGRMISDGSTDKATAFSTAFGNAAQYTAKDTEIKDANGQIDTWITKNLDSFTTWGGWQPWGTTNLNASGKQALRNAMAREVAVRSKASGGDIPPEALIGQVYRQVSGNGSFERYGQFGWGNAPGTATLGRQLGLLDEEANKFLPEFFDQKLKASGYSDGADGEDYRIIRQRDRSGKPLVIITPVPRDGSVHSPVPIRYDELQAYVSSRKRGAVSAGAAGPFKGKPISQIKQQFPQKPSENGFQYQQRLGRIQWTGNPER